MRLNKSLSDLAWGLRYSRPRASHLLRVDAIRFMVAWARYTYLARSHGLRTFSAATPGVVDRTVEHNLKGLKDLVVVRSEMLLHPLSVIETVSADSKVLSVGPRTEGELLNLVAHGFKKSNIRGLDLISYSPWVDLGDMHAMPYADNTWDVIVLAWVLAYSDDWEQAAREVVRVARPGAAIAIGVEYNPRTDEELTAEAGYQIGAADRILSTDQILKLFGSSVDTVYFTHDVQPSRHDEVGSIATVFSLRKEGV